MDELPIRIRFFSAVEPGWSYYRDLLPFLAETGAQIQLMISTSVYRDGRENLTRALEDQNVTIVQVPVRSFGATGQFRKAFIYMTYILGALVRSLFGKQVDLNVFLTQPPFFALWGYVLQRLRGQKYAVVVMDIHPDVAVQGGLIDRNSLGTRIAQLFSRFTLRNADRVIAIGRCMASYLEAVDVAPERISIVPNWANEQVFPVSHQENLFRKELGLEDHFVVLYSGNIGLSHFFDDILTVARELKGHEDIKFVFVGDGVRRQEIETQQQEDGLENVLLLPFQPLETLAYSLSLGDVHFISLRDGFSGLVVPSKTYSTLAAGRPVIFQGPQTSEIAYLVEENRVGSVIPLRSPQLLKQAICQYYSKPELVRQEGARALGLANGEYSRERALERYHAAFLKTVDNPLS